VQTGAGKMLAGFMNFKLNNVAAGGELRPAGKIVWIQAVSADASPPSDG
jgi:hypothetical protein